LKSRAIAAALARAYIPKLTMRPDHTSGPIISGVTTKDPLIPDGYIFKASALCEGLISLFSRLVRPIWHKPAVVVTEGRMIKLRWSESMMQSPAKVETIFDDSTLLEIGALLRNLLMLMKGVFSRAVKNVPGISHQTTQYMDIDDQGDNNLLTKSMQYNINMRNASTGVAVPLSHLEAEQIARQLEEKNIHSLYRVLARLVQLLNLMSLLRRAHGMVEFKEIDWGLLHGLTISQLVQSPEAQDRLENLLNSLVTTSVSKQSSASVSSAQADQLANLFAEQCYLFFSPASRFAYHGLRAASEAMSLPSMSPNRNALAVQAAQYLRQAAMHWHSEPLVTGRMINSKGKESFDQIARRAIECCSPLARATEALMELEDVVNVVEVCLITASNFTEKRSLAYSSTNGAFEGNYELQWEHNLYHKRRDEFLVDAGDSLKSQAAKISSNTVVALGTEVTGQAAIDSCYALIFYHLSTLLSAGKAGLADSMVSACAAAGDSTFISAFFSYLLENDHADTLLRIDSPDLCQWLSKRDDPDLLWRYYTVQRRYREAGQVAFLKAKDRSRLGLTDRMEWLSRSLNSFESAMDGRLGSFTTAELEDSNLRAKEVGDALQVAQLQYRILNAIDLVILKETSMDLYNKLNNELLPVSELYNDYAAAFSLFDECLLIIHTCRFEDVQTIHTLWTNVICEEILPCATRNEDLYLFLIAFAGSVGINNMVNLVVENEDHQSFRMLENGDWEKPLVRRIVALGKNLYGKGASYVFPVEFILFNIERTADKWDHRLFHSTINFLTFLSFYFQSLSNIYRSYCHRVGRFL
jgi:nuclear pore complex protein Nup155